MLSQAYSDSAGKLRGSYFCYFLAALVMLATAWFIIEGIEATEPDSPARNAKVASGVLLLFLEGCVFSLAGRFQQHAFILRLLGWSIFVLQIVLMTLANYSIGATAGKSAAITTATVGQVTAHADALRDTGKTLKDSADKLNKSKHGWLNSQGGAAASEAAKKTSEAGEAIDKLNELKKSVSTPLIETLGPTWLMALSCFWSLILECAGIALMHVAGSLRQEAAAASNARPVDVQILELLQQIHGVPPVAAPAPALANFKPASAVAPGASGGLSYSSKMTLAGAGALGALGAAPMAQAAPAAPLAASATAPESAHTAGPGAPVPAQSAAQPVSKKRPVVQVGTKLDTGTSGLGAARYNRIKAAVKAGKLKPSTRAVQAAEGGGGDVVKAYLRQLEKEGVTVRQGRGYALKKGSAKAN